MLGVAPDTVRRYETGEIRPADDVVLSMCDFSGLAVLGTWHLRQKSEVAAAVLPEVERLPLPQAVVQLLAAIRDFESAHHADALLDIAADAVVSSDEARRFKEIVRDLQPLIRAALQIDFAEKG